MKKMMVASGRIAKARKEYWVEAGKRPTVGPVKEGGSRGQMRKDSV